MASNLKVLQVIPRLGYGGAETGCYDIAHFLAEKNCKSIIVTSGGPLIQYIRKEKVVIPWKDFNKNMAISVEYNLEY